MKSSTLIQLLSVAAVAYAGVIAPQNRSTPCSTVVVVSTQDQTQIQTMTETRVTTVIAQPGSVTVALQDPDAIISSISSAISVESEQLEIGSQIAPINPLTSGRPLTTTSADVFTRTIAVPVIEATNNATIPGQSSTVDVYFVDAGNGTTSWLTNFTPEKSMTIGTTTVTLSPVAPTPSSQEISSSSLTHATSTSTSTITSTLSRASQTSSTSAAGILGMADEAQNSSMTSMAYVVPTRVCSKTQVLNASSSHGFMTLPSSSLNATHTASLSSSLSLALPTGADSLPVNITFPIGDSYQQKRSGDELRQRAVCEWVTVNVGGTPASWRNNWDGSQTVDCATVSTQAPESEAPTPVLATTTIVTVEAVPVASTTTTGESTMSPGPATMVSSTVTDTAPAETASCGVPGDLTLDFDTLPVFYAPDNDTAPFPPIPNPYRHLFFACGWAYVPPPTVPVSPQEGRHLAVHVPCEQETDSSDSGSWTAGQVPAGGFGAGPRASVDAYWFDAKNMYVFCDNGAADAILPCDIVATGYQWEEASQSERIAVTQHFPQPPCPGYRDCQTQEIFLSAEFRNLSSLSLSGIADGERKMVFMDTVQLTWSNDTCDAGLRRASET